MAPPPGAAFTCQQGVGEPAEAGLAAEPPGAAFIRQLNLTRRQAADAASLPDGSPAQRAQH